MLINISSIAPLNGEKNDMTSHGINEFSEIDYEIVSILILLITINLIWFCLNLLGTISKSVVNNPLVSPLCNSKIESFAFDIPSFGSDYSPHAAPYQFSTPLNCKSVFTVGNGRKHPKDHSEPVPTNIRRRRTRNVHFMMAGGKMTSSEEESPITLVDLDRSMDTNTSS